MTAPLMHVQPRDLKRIWPHIRARVQALSELPGQDWLAEHVFHELMDGGTHLFTTEGFRGFIVTQILASPYSRKLHVWLASKVGDGDRSEYLWQLKSIAAENDCDTITFASDRTGWKRALPGIRATTLYSIDVGE